MSNDIKIIDNFLNQDEFNSIKDVIFGNNFSWYHSPNIAYKNDPHKILESFFVHMIYDEDVIQSRYYDHFAGIFLPKIKQVCEIKSLIRIKTNFYPATENLIEHPPHNDYNFRHLGCIFSMNTCDGFTRFGKNDDQIIGSKENRMIFFDPFISHNSTNTTDAQARIIINFNFL